MTGTESHFEHEKYEELCALATAGILSPEESERLFTHLNECAECSEIFAQYRSLATDGMDFLAGHFAVPKTVEAFDEPAALARLMHATEAPRPHVVPMPARDDKSVNPSHWYRSPMLRGVIAASLLLSISLASYQFGFHSRPNSVNTAIATNPVLADLAAQKQALQRTIDADNQKIAQLDQQAAASKSETDKLRLDASAANQSLAAFTSAIASQKQQSDSQIAALTADRDSSLARLNDAQKLYQTVQDELTTLRNQHSQDLLRMASLDERVTTLNASLSDQNTRAKSDEQYLASDKDIRDLIGARNLYIADIMDVNEEGQSRQPFGRVFYTKTKSLIFYAYDLDRQPGVKRASTFQVWGRTGPADSKPLNLGMLYMDSETNRRWTLKVDNPRQLAQLDAIFVTVEPRPQTDKPTGKPFLYASLRREANHP